MSKSPGGEAESRRRAQLLDHLEKMVAAGRITKEEVERLAATPEPGDFDNLVREIRRRHLSDRAKSAPPAPLQEWSPSAQA